MVVPELGLSRGETLGKFLVLTPEGVHLGNEGFREGVEVLDRRDLERRRRLAETVERMGFGTNKLWRIVRHLNYCRLLI